MNDPLRFTSKILTSLCFTIAVVALCYAYVDRPVALYMESLHLSYMPFLRFFENFPMDMVHATLVTWLVQPFLPERVRTSLWSQAALKIATTVTVAAFLAENFKSYFGRYWTRTWVCNNPSFINTGDYGFNFFQGGPAFRSFPSGHACVVTASCMAIALCFPSRGVRVLMALAAGSTIATVLVQNFHFVGDLCAGTWLGTVTALCVHRAWPRSGAGA